MTTIVKAYQDILIRKIFQKIASYEKRLNNARKTETDNKQTYSAVCSQRHWQASATIDLCLKEIERLQLELVEMDELTNWSDNLHQDRYKFVEKYPTVLENYESSYKWRVEVCQ